VACDFVLQIKRSNMHDVVRTASLPRTRIERNIAQIHVSARAKIYVKERQLHIHAWVYSSLGVYSLPSFILPHPHSSCEIPKRLRYQSMCCLASRSKTTSPVSMKCSGLRGLLKSWFKKAKLFWSTPNAIWCTPKDQMKANHLPEPSEISTVIDIPKKLLNWVICCRNKVKQCLLPKRAEIAATTT
jgi:hypothetical protein